MCGGEESFGRSGWQRLEHTKWAWQITIARSVRQSQERCSYTEGSDSVGGRLLTGQAGPS